MVIYKDIKYAALQCIIDFEINKLPVDLNKILDNTGIKTCPNCNVNILRPEHRAVALRKGDKYVIVYDDEDIITKRRFSIAHELGHIFLGHLTTDLISNPDPICELDASTFAL
jgi:Zn-dependent peptidase ImmA (M78 family)